ncbi:MAG: hypothetical protein ACYTFW_02605 [Planctomycetota bacterium]|jgi:hypothetical protein
MANGIDSKIFNNITTTDGYIYSITAFRNFKTGSIWLKNTGGTNQLNYTVDIRYHEIDTEADWEEKTAETALATNTSVVISITEVCSAIRVGVQSASAGNATTCRGFLIKKRH